MSSQTGLPTRRQFLERSAWGFGSAFILPSLLASCTDHQITPTDPNTPIIIPSYGAVEINWNDAAKVTVKTGLEAIPEVGEILGPLVEIFWPKSEQDVWSQVRTQVEDLIDQKIAESNYQLVSNMLGKMNASGGGGLIGLINVYRKAQYNYNYSVAQYYYDKKTAPDPTDVRREFGNVRDFFVDNEIFFREQGHELELLPLFAQFANLYLALLREGILYGQDWGRSSMDHQQDVIDLQDAIKDFTNYANSTYSTGVDNFLSPKRDDKIVEPFRTKNKFIRGLILTVLDYSDT